MHTQLMQRVFNVSVYTVYVPVNFFQSCVDNFLFIYLTSTKKRIKCLAHKTGHKTATPVSHKLGTLPYTEENEPLRPACSVSSRYMIYPIQLKC